MAWWDAINPWAAPSFAAPGQQPQLPIPQQPAPYLPAGQSPVSASSRYRLAQSGDDSFAPQFQRTGPTLPGMINDAMLDTGRMMTTPPPQLPKGAYMDAGGPAQGTADSQEFANWLGEMHQRGELAPSMALGMIGGGGGFAPRSALGSSGAKMVQPALQAAEEAQPGIRAYHSSPHDFDQFDLSKIGTGEGAQAYGHGIYVAESPAVSGQGGEYWKQFARRFSGQSDEMAHAVRILEGTGGDRAAALAKVEQVLRDNTPTAYPRGRMEAVRDLLASDKQVGPRTYEVNIAAHPDQFLDWDKPLSEQHPHIRDRLGHLDIDEFKYPLEPNKTPVSSVYYGLGRRHEQTSPLSEARPPDVSATRILSEAGIPGIKYFDQGSRGAGTGTSNYVVFDPKLIEIVKKYGIAAIAPYLASKSLPIPQQQAPVF